MRLGDSYRLNAETLGITPTDQPRTKLMVPKGGVVTVKAGPNSIVAIIAGPPDRYRMVDVTWKGEDPHAFRAGLARTRRTSCWREGLAAAYLRTMLEDRPIRDIDLSTRRPSSPFRYN